MDGAQRHGACVVPELALAWISRDSRPRLLVTDDLRILWINSAADAALADRHDLEIRDGQLATINAAHQDELADFVRDASPASVTLALPSDDGRGHVLLRAQEVGRGEDGICVGIQFFRSYLRSFEYADFEMVFGLTRAEHQVLLLMLEGKTADEVSSGKQVSIDTVRTQIRQIYDKLGVSSREGLFRRIRPYIL
ncbi:MAG: helix-turn-helix transcriptional regulator [Allosphingosinicella sp.]